MLDIPKLNISVDFIGITTVC